MPIELDNRLNSWDSATVNLDALLVPVAAELGCSDPFHFSRAFKSVFGLSPEAFRRLR